MRARSYTWKILTHNFIEPKCNSQFYENTHVRFFVFIVFTHIVDSLLSLLQKQNKLRWKLKKPNSVAAKPIHTPDNSHISLLTKESVIVLSFNDTAPTSSIIVSLKAPRVSWTRNTFYCLFKLLYRMKSFL